MLRDWIFWLTSAPRTDLWLVLCPLLLCDAPRYLLGALLLCLTDATTGLWSLLCGNRETPRFTHCPTVCVVIAGLNEAPSIKKSLFKLRGCYPRLEIIVVDDGSNDGMSEMANEFARNHPGVIVITKRRGGKSSALNAALPFTRADVVVILDADSELSPNAIWEIVQPLQDPQVAGVSGNVVVRNRNYSLITRLQAFEYMRSILVGRSVAARLGLLGIISGAFGAFRRETIARIGGWDVGPGEDEDIVLRLRKLGYGIEFAPYAECATDAPTSWKVLVKQRRRWEWAVITFECRKHIDMANPFSRNFRLGNCMLFFERWVFNLFLPIIFWAYLLLASLIWPPASSLNLLLLFYLIYVAIEFCQWLCIMFYTNHPRRDVWLFYLPLLIPPYQLLQRCVTTIALCEEIFTRRSFRDGFVPQHVRERTWQW